MRTSGIVPGRMVRPQLSREISMFTGVSGDIVRFVSAGVVAPASGSQVACGVLNGSRIVPLAGFQIVNMLAAVAVGGSVYLSNTAGKGTQVVSTAGGNPIGVAVADMSVGASYRALVHFGAAVSLAGGAADGVECAISAALSGCDPSLSLWTWDDYFQQGPSFGMLAQNVAGYGPEGADLGVNGFLLHLNLFKNLNVARFGSWKWALGSRVRLASGADYFVGLDNAAQVFGLRYSEALGLRLYYGAAIPAGNSWGAYQQILQPGALPAGAFHSLGVASRGDDTFYVRADAQILGPFTIVTGFAGPAAYGTVHNYNLTTSAGVVTNAALWFLSQQRA